MAFLVKISLSSCSLDHLPQNPCDIQQIKESYAYLNEARKEQKKLGSSSSECVQRLYRNALTSLLIVHQIIKEKDNSTFSPSWADFFRWKASCERKERK